MSKIGEALVVVGGSVVVGGLIYWYFKQQPPVPPPPECEDYPSESECLAHDCYWYEGACHSSPPSPPDKHYACGIDEAVGLIGCYLVEGAGADECDPFASPDFCWGQVACSADMDCGSGAKCWEGKCYWLANELLDYSGGRVESVKFMFEDRCIGNKLMGGNITFTLPAWNAFRDPHVKIFLLRDGKRVKKIYDEWHNMLPATFGEAYIRTDMLPAIYLDAEAIDGIEFWCMGYWFFGLYAMPVMTEVHSQYVYI